MEGWMNDLSIMRWARAVQISFLFAFNLESLSRCLVRFGSFFQMVFSFLLRRRYIKDFELRFNRFYTSLGPSHIAQFLETAYPFGEEGSADGGGDLDEEQARQEMGGEDAAVRSNADTA